MKNPFSLQGKRILVTGASSGIGRGIAVACSRMGASVMMVGRNEDRLKETNAALQDTENRIFICDITLSEAVETMVERLPILDGIVHCAGIGQRIPAKLLTAEDVDYVMDINFKAPVLLQKELLRQKKINKKASIVFIASIASWSPSVGNSVYSASKGAIKSYAKCLSLELAPRIIRVNTISPAMVWTDLVTKDGVDEEELRKDEQLYPLKRYGTPEDIGNLTVYLLSDASSWMTGSDITISGGAS